MLQKIVTAIETPAKMVVHALKQTLDLNASVLHSGIVSTAAAAVSFLFKGARQSIS